MTVGLFTDNEWPTSLNLNISFSLFTDPNMFYHTISEELYSLKQLNTIMSKWYSSEDVSNTEGKYEKKKIQ